MPPHAQWTDWFTYVWKSAFEVEGKGKRNYYYFVNFVLSYICYPLGRDSTRRRVVDADATSAVAVGTIVSSAGGVNTFGINITDMSGMFFNLSLIEA